MNLDRLKIVEDIVNGSSSRLNEGYFNKHYNSVFLQIKEHISSNPKITFYTKEDRKTTISTEKEKKYTHFPQMLWYYVNDIKERPLCKTCGVVHTTFNKKWSDGFRDFCSHQCSAKSNNTKNKRVQTTQELYNVDNVAQLQSVRDKIEETNMIIYGFKSTFQSPIVRETWRKNMLEKYGYDHTFKIPYIIDIIKIKRLQYCMEKYGTPNIFVSDKWKQLSKNTKENNTFNKYVKIHEINNEYEFISYKDLNFNIKHNKCGTNFEISLNRMNDRTSDMNSICLCCYPISENDSIPEKEIFNYVESLGVECLKDKTILKGKELDVYIPSHNLAIEHNGVYHHNDTFKPNNYHLNKSNGCLENNIHLLHIWGDEWKYKRNIVKSIIKNYLNKDDITIDSNLCEIRIVNEYNVVSNFLNTNHIDGETNNLLVNLGLYFKNELVSLMCFKKNKKYIEMFRFCNLLNHNIINAERKLFTYFINNYSYNKIISFSDFRINDGKMLENLGFDKKELSKPDFYWVKNHDRFNRNIFTFNKLKKMSFFDYNLTIDDMIKGQNYNKIYNCGLVKWVYKKRKIN